MYDVKEREGTKRRHQVRILFPNVNLKLFTLRFFPQVDTVVEGM